MVDALLWNSPKEKEGIDHLKDWRRRLEPEEYEDDDRFMLRSHITHIVTSWKFALHNIGLGSYEDAHRKAADDLISLAFQLRPNSGHTFW